MLNTAAIMFLVLFGLIFLGFPIAHSLLAAAVVVMTMLGKTNTFPIIVQRLFAGIDSFPLMAIPLFVMSGNIMARSGISDRLIEFIRLFLRRTPASTASITVGASALFGAISGSAGATTAAIGGMTMPQMVKKGYEVKDAAAIGGATGMLGMLIPPSIPLMTYAVTAGVSISTMFIAGILPGLLLTAVYIVLSMIKYHKIEPAAKDRVPLKKALKITWDALLALMMPVIILGGIYGGIFTATEAAAVASVYAIIVGKFIYRTLSWKAIGEEFVTSAITTTAIMMLIAFSSPFSWTMASTGITQAITNAILNAFSSKFAILLMINIILLFLGCFVDTISIILLITPILLGVANSLGLSYVYIGVILCFNTGLGLVTPPLGQNLLLSTSLMGMKSLTPSVKPVMMYLIAGIVVLLILTYIPSLTLWIPRIMGCPL